VKQRGWLILWSIFLVFGILAPPAAAPCSIEGVIYSKLPLSFHLKGLVEISLQTLFFSIILTQWVKPAASKETSQQISKKKAIFLRISFAIMIGCFAYIGYAIGGILSAKIAGRAINLSGSSISMRTQMMFVFAFGINVIGILIATGKSYLGKIPLWLLFIIFWILDTAAPLAYQGIFLGMMPIHLGLILGFFPAVIILISYKVNFKNFAKLNNRGE
jgi:hypothetical protein